MYIYISKHIIRRVKLICDTAVCALPAEPVNKGRREMRHKSRCTLTAELKD